MVSAKETKFERRTAAKILCEYAAADGRNEKLRQKKARISRAHTHTAALFNESSHVSLTDAIDEQKPSHCLGSSLRPSVRSAERSQKCRFPINLLSSIHPIRFWCFAVYVSLCRAFGSQWALSLYLLLIGHNCYCYYSAGHKLHMSAQ